MARKPDYEKRVEKAVGDLFGSLFAISQEDPRKAYGAAGTVLDMLLEMRGSLSKKIASESKELTNI